MRPSPHLDRFVPAAAFFAAVFTLLLMFFDRW